MKIVIVPFIKPYHKAELKKLAEDTDAELIEALDTISSIVQESKLAEEQSLQKLKEQAYATLRNTRPVPTYISEKIDNVPFYKKIQKHKSKKHRRNK